MEKNRLPPWQWFLLPISKLMYGITHTPPNIIIMLSHIFLFGFVGRRVSFSIYNFCVASPNEKAHTHSAIIYRLCALSLMGQSGANENI